jgi:hypothetical protein
MTFCRKMTLSSLSLTLSEMSSSAVKSPSISPCCLITYCIKIERRKCYFSTIHICSIKPTAAITSCRNRKGGFLSNFSVSGGFLRNLPRPSCVFFTAALSLASSPIIISYFNPRNCNTSCSQKHASLFHKKIVTYDCDEHWHVSHEIRALISQWNFDQHRVTMATQVQYHVRVKINL